MVVQSFWKVSNLLRAIKWKGNKAPMCLREVTGSPNKNTYAGQYLYKCNGAEATDWINSRPHKCVLFPRRSAPLWCTWWKQTATKARRYFESWLSFSPGHAANLGEFPEMTPPNLCPPSLWSFLTGFLCFIAYKPQPFVTHSVHNGLYDINYSEWPAVCCQQIPNWGAVKRFQAELGLFQGVQFNTEWINIPPSRWMQTNA